MDVREDFWGCVLSKDKKVYVWSVPDEDELGIDKKLSISQACLGLQAKKDERNVVDVITEDDDGNEMTFTILSLRLGGAEQCKLELGFQNKTTFKLVQGSGPVHICGLNLQALPEGLSDESDEEEETPIKANPPKATKKRAVEENAVEEPPTKKPTLKAEAPVPEEKPAAAKQPEPNAKVEKKVEEEESDSEEEDEDSGEDDDEEGSEDESEEEEVKPKQKAVAPVKKEAPKKVETVVEEAKKDTKKTTAKSPFIQAEAEEDDDSEMDSDDEEMDSEDDEEGESGEEDMESDDDDDEDDDEDDEDEDESDSEEEEEAKPAKKKPMVNGHGKAAKGKVIGTPQQTKKLKDDKAKPPSKAEVPKPQVSAKGVKDEKTPQKTPQNTPQGKQGQQKTAAKTQKGKVEPKTPEPPKDINQIKLKLAKSPNLPKSVEKFKNFMRSAHKIADDKTVTDLWDWLQKNKK